MHGEVGGSVQMGVVGQPSRRGADFGLFFDHDGSVAGEAFLHDHHLDGIPMSPCISAALRSARPLRGNVEGGV